MENLESTQFVITVLQNEDTPKLSASQIAEALENYITRTKCLRAGADFFIKVV